MTLEELYKIIQNRKKIMPKNSYTASLLREGNDRILQKIGEETIEVIIAAKNRSRKEVIQEIADLLFHLLVLMASLGITPTDISQELEKRRKN